MENGSKLEDKMGWGIVALEKRQPSKRSNAVNAMGG
jgi:hypothetical protein